jgi:undecaprenyl diphosphate synthase
LDKERIPSHIAIVMDGNGRWAAKRSLPRLAGHNAGMGVLKEIVKSCSSLGVGHLTVYAFSTENWKRPEEEVGGIFRILVAYVEKELAELHQNYVRVTVLGDYSALPREAVIKLDEALDRTKENTGLAFHIALNYGSRDEILQGIRSLANEVRDGRLNVEEIDGQKLSEHLYTKGIPDPDLVIRTSGEKRLSNFLLWQSAYSEFVFTDVYWPDFTPAHLDAAIEEYQGRSRRFGGVK